MFCKKSQNQIVLKNNKVDNLSQPPSLKTILQFFRNWDAEISWKVNIAVVGGSTKKPL